jgi:hypothetical protein
MKRAAHFRVLLSKILFCMIIIEYLCRFPRHNFYGTHHYNLKENCDIFHYNSHPIFSKDIWLVNFSDVFGTVSSPFIF